MEHMHDFLNIVYIHAGDGGGYKIPDSTTDRAFGISGYHGSGRCLSKTGFSGIRMDGNDNVINGVYGAQSSPKGLDKRNVCFQNINF